MRRFCQGGKGSIGPAFARLGPPNPGLDIYFFKVFEIPSLLDLKSVIEDGFPFVPLLGLGMKFKVVLFCFLVSQKPFIAHNGILLWDRLTYE